MLRDDEESFCPNKLWVIQGQLMKVFGLMGLLCGISACISTARLNAATNAAGTLDELYVIASAEIGSTSLAGGGRTLPGAQHRESTRLNSTHQQQYRMSFFGWKNKYIHNRHSQ